MRFLLEGEYVDRPSLWREKDHIRLIDQRLLPSRTRIISVTSLQEQIEAISTLAVRGAPAIGVFGALSLALAIHRGDDPALSYERLLESRPTAVDLRNCMDKVMLVYEMDGPKAVMQTAETIAENTIESCRRIGIHGAGLIPERAKIMTHCNAGALATLDWGTALSPIRIKARSGNSPFVWVSETRPLLQGSRLTTWELLNEGIEHSLIVDSASGSLLSEGEVDMVIVGADRVAANGDIANKIGTLEKAIMAKEFGVPFYVAFPETTIDTYCPEGSGIPIERRSGDEVGKFNGRRISPSGTGTFNPAFDVTPFRYINGYITENGYSDRIGLLERIEQLSIDGPGINEK